MPLVLGIFQLMLQYHHFASQLDNWMSFANAISKTYLVSHQITVGCILLNHFLGERFLSPFCKPVDYKTINLGDLLHSHRLQNRKLNKREKTKTPVSLTNQFRIQGLGTPTTHMPGQQNNGGVATKMKM